MTPAPQHKAMTIDGVRCAVITVSDTRTKDNDTGGRVVLERLTAAGHVVHAYEILADDQALVSGRVKSFAGDEACQAVLLTGGTGLSRRDSTFEALIELLDKRLDGFGELFRSLSYEQVGPAAMLSRAVAGLCGSTAVFAVPGSPRAVELAMDKLIIPELGHIVWLARS